MGDAVKGKIKEAIKAYDKIAKLYGNYKYDKLLQYQLNKFISLLQGKKILDAGCGTGRDVEYFLDEGFDITGIDISRGMIDEAKRRVPEGAFKVMDFTKTRFNKECFHGIWCMAALADIPRENSEKVFKEFTRILDKSGILYLAVKRGEGQEIIKKHKYNDQPRIYVYYEKIELEDILKQNGFEILHSIISEDEGKEWVEVFARKL